MRSLLVTGGAGFIGCNFIFYLQKHYPEMKITCVDVMTYAANENAIRTAKKKDNFHFLQESITNRNEIYQLFEAERFDAVVNFAAESHVDRSIQQPELFLQTNILGTGILMDACLQYQVPRFHQISTDEVYGDLPLDHPELRFREDSLLRASSPYSASKASADLLVLAYVRTYGLNATISRCSNNFGPYQHAEKLIPKIILNALQEESIPVYGKGKNVRDWIYVEDHCRAVDFILRKGQGGEIYNIGGGNEMSNLEVIHSILQLLGKSDQLITFVPDRPGHDLRYSIDYSKAIQKLGWTPSVGFEEGIEKTVAWFLSETATAAAQNNL